MGVEGFGERRSLERDDRDLLPVEGLEEASQLVREDEVGCSAVSERPAQPLADGGGYLLRRLRLDCECQSRRYALGLGDGAQAVPVERGGRRRRRVWPTESPHALQEPANLRGRRLHLGAVSAGVSRALPTSPCPWNAIARPAARASSSSMSRVNRCS